MLMQDLRYAFRALFRTPVFTAIAVLCLSLAIGVNTMIFGVVDGVLVQSLPYQDAERLVVSPGNLPSRQHPREQPVL